MHRTGSALPLVIVILACLASPVVGADRERGGEFGFLLGGLQPDDDLVVGSRNIEPTVGIRGGAVFSRYLGWFIDGIYADIDTHSNAGDAETIAVRSGFDFLFPGGKHTRWFISLSAGWMEVDRQRASDSNGAIGSFSFGQRIHTRERRNLRWELRADHSLDDELAGERITQAMLQLGYTWGPSRLGADQFGTADPNSGPSNARSLPSTH